MADCQKAGGHHDANVRYRFLLRLDNEYMIAKLSDLLNSILPDSKIYEDLQECFKECGYDLELTDNVITKIPSDVNCEIVTKIYYHENFKHVGFGTIVVLISIGKFIEDEHGLHSAEYCFFTLHYNDDCEMVTYDVHEEF